MTNSHLSEKRTVTCEEGHEHRETDLDKVGMDYHCPECFAKIPPGKAGP